MFLQDGDLPIAVKSDNPDSAEGDGTTSAPDSPNMWFIPNNGVFAPPKLDGIFRLGVTEDGKYFYSNVLQISKEDRWYTLKFEGRLPRNGTTNICIQTNKRNYYITIVNKYEQNIQVMHLLPTFTIANNTFDNFTIRPMSVVKSNKNTLIVDNGANLNLNALKIKKDLFEVPLLSWAVISAPSTKRKASVNQPVPQGADLIRCIQMGQNDLFCDPLLIGEVTTGDLNDQRMTFSLPATPETNNLASPSNTLELQSCNKLCVLTMHQYMGRMKLVIQENCQPQLIVYNNTSATLILGMYCIVALKM